VVCEVNLKKLPIRAKNIASSIVAMMQKIREGQSYFKELQWNKDGCPVIADL
jgi:hypothetical protein